MNNIVAILFFSVVAGFLVLDFLKDRKAYRLLAVVPILIAIFYQTSFSKTINSTLSMLLTGLMVIIAVVVFYLAYKDKKRSSKE